MSQEHSVEKASATELHSAVAKAILLLMTLQGTTQQELADNAPCSQGHLSQILKGERIPSVDLCGRLAEALGVTYLELLQIAHREFFAEKRSVKEVADRITKKFFDQYVGEIKKAADCKGNDSVVRPRVVKIPQAVATRGRHTKAFGKAPKQFVTG